MALCRERGTKFLEVVIDDVVAADDRDLQPQLPSPTAVYPPNGRLYPDRHRPNRPEAASSSGGRLFV